MVRRLFLLLFFILFLGYGLYAQSTNSPRQARVPGDELTLKVAVIGPGSELYFWWGHIALIIDDSNTGRSSFYDYGLFSFDSENFFYNFAFGRLLYSCGVSPSEYNYDVYRRTNRSVVVYTLDLPPETKIKVRDFAQINILPENRDYFYHHFRDNCSTRIRDIIDLATDGQFKDKFENKISNFTLRDQVRRHTWFSPTGDWFLSFLMGQVIDTEITGWEDMFLPSEVGRNIEDFWYTDIHGQQRKLVTSVETIYAAEGRPQVADVPKNRWPLFLLFSLGLSLIFGFFFFLYSKNIGIGRVLAGLSISICSLFFGLASSAVYFMSLFTNHDYTFENINMIFCSPLLLAGFPLGICYAFTKKQNKLFIYDQIIRVIWLLVVIGVIISIVLRFLPWFYQQNQVEQVLILPIALIFALQPVGLKDILVKWRLYGHK